MDYPLLYEKLILSRKNLNRKKNDGIYYEKHHIKPVCLGGHNTSENLVLLTAKEHYIAHLLLTRCYSGEAHGKMCFALWRMCQKNSIQKRIISATQYAEAKRLKMENYKVSEETRKKMSEARIGKKMSEESKEKLSHSKKGVESKLKGKTFEEIYNDIEKSELRRMKNSIALKGRTAEDIYGKEQADKFREITRERSKNNKYNLGKKRSEETKQKMREAKLGKPSPNKGKKYKNKNEITPI